MWPPWRWSTTGSVAPCPAVDESTCPKPVNLLLRLQQARYGKGSQSCSSSPPLRTITADDSSISRHTSNLADVAEDVLRCLPGVSSVGARRLLEHFGSLRAVFSADERELRQVHGIVPVRGAALARLFIEYERG